MGLLSALLGNASEADVDDVEENLEQILDLEADLKIWISGNSTPIARAFSRGGTILKCRKHWRPMSAGDAAPRPT